MSLSTKRHPLSGSIFWELLSALDIILVFVYVIEWVCTGIFCDITPTLPSPRYISPFLYINPSTFIFPLIVILYSSLSSCVNICGVVPKPTLPVSPLIINLSYISLLLPDDNIYWLLLFDIRQLYKFTLFSNESFCPFISSIFVDPVSSFLSSCIFNVTSLPDNDKRDDGVIVPIPILPSGLIIILSSPAVTNCSSSLSAFALDSAFT